MPKTKSFIFISILSFVAIFGLLSFLSRSTLAIGSYGDEEACLANGCDWDDVNNRCICPNVSPTRTPTATPSGTKTPAPTFTLPPETITPFPTPTPTPSSNLSQWCQFSYCGGCTQNECTSSAILTDLKMPINEVCEWRDDFCYTQMMSSDKVAKLSQFGVQKVTRPVGDKTNSDQSQYYWNNNYSVQRDRAWILAPSQVVTFTETGPKEYLCTNPQTPHETTCPPANPPLTKRDDSNANVTSGVGRLWQSAVTFFKNNVISPLFGEKTLAKRSYSDQDSCVANGCDWIPNAQSNYPPYEFTGKCECPGICYVIPADCGFKTPWFIRDAETYTLTADQPYSGDCGVCKHLVNKNQVYIPTLIFKSTYTTVEGGGGKGGMLEEPMDEGGCQSIWDIMNTECSPLRLFKNTLEKSNVAHLFSPKAQAIKAYPDQESCEADNCDWISYSPSHTEGFCICPTIPPAPDANCNIAGAENSVYSQLTGIPENYSLPSAGVTLKTVLAGSASKWSGQVRFWAERTLLKYFGVDKTQIHKGDKVTISWSVINPAYNKDNQPLIYLYAGPVPVMDPNHHIDIVKYDGGDSSTTTDDRYFVGELGTAGSVVAQPEEDTIFYLIVRGVTGEGMKDLVSDEIIVRVIDEDEGWVDLKVKGNAVENDYTDGPIAITRGTDVALKWTSEENVDSCTASATPENAAWTGTVKTTGNKIIYGVTNSTTFKLDCTLKNGKAISDSATVNIGEDPNDPTRQGFIEVKARLINGTSTTEYTGPVKYAINGPQSFTGDAPQLFSARPGQYVLTYVSGGPNEAVCITPSKAGVVESQKTLTFYLDFEVQNLCSINVNYQVPESAASWDRKASYVLIGPTILTGNSLPYSFTQIPPGVYYISYISGAPENLVFSGVLEGNGQVCYPKQPLQFTLQFTEPGATPPVPLPSPEIGNNPPTAKIGCAADDPVRCIGTIDGDPDTPTISLYNASTDPDKDITSCTWTIQKQGEEPISKRTCQPVTIGDDIGSYTVTLRVTDSKNNTNETQITAQVKNVNELTPKFVWNPQIPTVGKTVNFYDRSLAPSGRSIASWLWSFEDGSPATSTSPNPEVTFNSSGPKSVTLTVTDNLGNSSSTSKVIDVRNIAPQWKEVIPK